MNGMNIENRDVQILSTGVRLEGIVSIPEEANGIVLFVHGSGSSRHSPRNQYVAQTLQEGGLATLLFDLLTPQEEEIDQRMEARAGSLPPFPSASGSCPKGREFRLNE